MNAPQKRDASGKVGRLAAIAAALRKGECVEVTRLTVVKSLCADARVAALFATFLASKTLRRVEGRKRSRRPALGRTGVNLQLMLDNALQVNPHLKIFPVSAYTGDGLDAWYGWLRDELSQLGTAH